MLRRKNAHKLRVVRLVFDAENGFLARREVYVARLVLEHGFEQEFDTDGLDLETPALESPYFGQPRLFAQCVDGFPACGGV